jgi:hypothetical protein
MMSRKDVLETREYSKWGSDKHKDSRTSTRVWENVFISPKKGSCLRRPWMLEFMSLILNSLK